MPVYEYKCDNKHYHERTLSIDTRDTTIYCIDCGGVCKRVISNPTIRFKGSGFYTTDKGKSSG